MRNSERRGEGGQRPVVTPAPLPDAATDDSYHKKSKLNFPEPVKDPELNPEELHGSVIDDDLGV